MKLSVATTIIGCLLTVTGVALLSIPAAIILAGILLTSAGLLTETGER